MNPARIIYEDTPAYIPIPDELQHRKVEAIFWPLDDELQRMWILRKLLHPMDEIAAIDFLLDKLKQTKTNEEFFMSMKRK